MRRRFGNKEKALEIDRVTEALLELGEASLHDQDNAELLSKLAFQLLEKGDRSNALKVADFLRIARYRKFHSGEALVRPDEPGDEFFLILSGEAEVVQRVVSTLLLRIGFLVTIL